MSSSLSDTASLLYGVLVSVAGDASIPAHGRHPNYNYLMRSDHKTHGHSSSSQHAQQAASTTAVVTSSRRLTATNSEATTHQPAHHVSMIWDKPYVYHFTGRKWPNTVFHRALCEAGSCTLMGAGSTSSSIQCTRFEIVGTPVIVERYQCDAFCLCRMYCCKSASPVGIVTASKEMVPTTSANHRGALAMMGGTGSASAATDGTTAISGAVNASSQSLRHLSGMSASSLFNMLLVSTLPMVQPDEGRRDASWARMTSSVVDVSESSASFSCVGGGGGNSNSCCASAASMTSASVASASSSSMGSTSASIGGLSSDNNTPARGVSESPVTCMSSPEPTPVLAVLRPSACPAWSAPQAIVLGAASTEAMNISPQTALRMQMVDGMFQQALSYALHSTSLSAAWARWQRGELTTMARKSVIMSLQEIMYVKGCSQRAVHHCIALLDRYVLHTMPLEFTPTSRAVRAAIACAITTASKASDIYPPELVSLMKSVDPERTSVASFSTEEMKFIIALGFRLNPLTAEEVVETLIEAKVGHTEQGMSNAALPTPPTTSETDRRMVAFARYLTDLSMQETDLATACPLHVGAAIAQFATESFRKVAAGGAPSMWCDRKVWDHLFCKLDPRHLQALVIRIQKVHADTCYATQTAERVPFLENMYSRKRTTTQEPVSIQFVAPSPVAAYV